MRKNTYSRIDTRKSFIKHWLHRHFAFRTRCERSQNEGQLTQLKPCHLDVLDHVLILSQNEAQLTQPHC